MGLNLGHNIVTYYYITSFWGGSRYAGGPILSGGMLGLLGRSGTTVCVRWYPHERQVWDIARRSLLINLKVSGFSVVADQCLCM